MSDQRSLSNVVFAAVIGIALIACTVVLTRGAVHIKSAGQVIRVTGSARQLIRSDFIIWKGQVSARGQDVGLAYRSLKAGVDKAKTYLVARGVAKDEILDSPVTTRILYAPLPAGTKGPQNEGYGEPPSAGGSGVFRKIEAYELMEELEVRSQNVDVVDNVSRHVTELISGGVLFESLAPKYLYTKLGELKVDILARAAYDAYNRASQIAKYTGCRVGAVRSARMGVMRITPAYTTVELDEYGTNDTSSLDKEITAVVTTEFAVN
jgi:uncharacterized protein